MKQCPHCSRTYTDDTLVFCTADGNMLAAIGSGADIPTVVLTRTPMQQPPTTHVSPTPNRSPVLKYVAIGLLSFLLLCVGGALALWMMSPKGDSRAGNQPPASPSPATAGDRAANASTPNKAKPSPRVVESDNTELVKSKPSPDEALPTNDPGTSRITFARGRVGQTVQGSIAKERMFVLRTGEGQSLFANVRGASGCVTFSNGSSSLSDETETGDTFLTIVNKCESPGKFTLSITVR